MFKRKIISYLQEWKNKKERKPLILRGARQVGKTSALLLFGEQNFEQTIHINLEKPEHNRLFSEKLTLNELEKTINVYFKKRLIPGKTLLFIDEIQELPWMVNMLRFFKEERPRLHVASAGSLFEVKLKEKGFSLPVGRVEFFWLYPLDFFEYLEAVNEKSLLEYLQNIKLTEKIPQGLHQKALSLFYDYSLVGGMPEAVEIYSQNKDLNKVNTIYSSFLTAFKDDVYKYSSMAKSKYLTFVLQQAPNFAGQPITYHKFAGSNYKSREMADAFDTLSKAMILYQIKATKAKNLPLTVKRKKPPKLLFLDIGLVNFCMGIQADYLNVKEFASFYRGRMGEQVVGQQLLASNLSKPAKIYYWYKKTGSQAEVDFCVEYNGKPLGIEVKAGKRGKLKSVISFLKTTNANTALRVYSGKFKKEKINYEKKTLISMPFYLLPRWSEIA